MNTPQAAKASSLVNEYAKRLALGFSELDHFVDDRTVETLAIFLLRTMGSESRDYHRPEHSLDVSKLEHPIPRFAGLFHDLIYLQVDPSWRLVVEFLDPFVPDENLSLNVTEALKKTSDPWHHAIAALFNLEFETKLTTAFGINEFLSAIVMYQKLSPFLPASEMLRAVACVEATIFLDKTCTMEKTPEERLRANLTRAIKKLDEDINVELILKETTQDCKKLIERDLASFASEDMSTYLSNTWNVMVENNQTLRNSYYLTADYRRAVYGVIQFISNLDAEKMFWGKDSPMVPRATHNLRAGMDYLKTFALSLSLTEIIAIATGGDAPYEMFVGPQKRSREHQTIHVNDILPLPEKVLGSEDHQEVYKILKEGRIYRCRFDQKNAPLAAYLFASMPFDKINELYDLAVLFHARKVSSSGDKDASEVAARAILSKFPQAPLRVIIETFTKTARARKKELDKLLKALS